MNEVNEVDEDFAARDSGRVRETISLLIASLTLIAALGCQSSHKPPPHAPATVAFDARMNQNGSVTFRSWNGKAYRMDSDTEIVFFPDQTAQMLEWGFSVTHYAGTYHLEPDGHVTATFHDYQPGWPAMILDVDGESLILRPIEDQGFIVGTRGSATIPKDANGFWPFRLIAGEDEKKVLEDLKRLGAGH